MRFSRMILVSVLVCLPACTQPPPSPDGAGQEPSTTSQEPLTTSQLGNGTQTICADGSGSLCSTLPTDMAGVPPLIGYIPDTNGGGEGAFNQTYIDYFGWQSFVALNWPVNANGQPSTTETLTTDTTSPRVWSTYATKDEVFKPSLLGLEQEACGDMSENLLLLRASKFDLSAFTEAFTPYPLIDRYGNFVLYDVRLNSTEVTYLESNHLTTKSGQADFGKGYDFTAGLGTDVGSIEIKTSWRIMTGADPSDSFYTTDARVVIPAEHSATGEPLCIEATVGLVGMHIMQKFTNPTDFSNFWAWATFEHVGNAPLADNAPVSQINNASTLTTLAPPPCERMPDPNDKTVYSFYNAACTTEDCPVNEPPSAPGNKFKWSATEPYASAYLTDGQYGTQVARCFDVYDSANTVTAAYRAKFGNSLWANYRLIGVQWAAASNTGSGPFASLKPFPAPIYLTNTTLETYLQTGSVEDPTAGAGSCITCHNIAVDTAGNNANFSFLPASAH